MRAYLVDAPGPPFRSADIRRPVPARGEILIRVRASGLNPLDSKIRRGKADHAKQPWPAVLGLDMAGTVVEVGPGVAAFRPGDEVYGMVGGVGGLQGTLAEFIVADAAWWRINRGIFLCATRRPFRFRPSPLGKASSTERKYVQARRCSFMREPAYCEPGPVALIL